MNGRNYWFGCALGLVSCGGVHKPSETRQTSSSAETAAQNSPGEAKAPDFDALVAREATGLTEQKVAGPEGRWTARVGAVGVPKVALAEGMSIVDVPIGSESSMRCQVFGEDVDTAGTIAEDTPRDSIREKGDPVMTAHLDAGNMKFTGHVDDQGLFERMQMPIGAVMVNFQRELIRGKL